MGRPTPLRKPRDAHGSHSTASGGADSFAGAGVGDCVAGLALDFGNLNIASLSGHGGRVRLHHRFADVSLTHVIPVSGAAPGRYPGPISGGRPSRTMHRRRQKATCRTGTFRSAHGKGAPRGCREMEMGPRAWNRLASMMCHRSDQNGPMIVCDDQRIDRPDLSSR